MFFSIISFLKSALRPSWLRSSKELVELCGINFSCIYDIHVQNLYENPSTLKNISICCQTYPRNPKLFFFNLYQTKSVQPKILLFETYQITPLKFKIACSPTHQTKFSRPRVIYSNTSKKHPCSPNCYPLYQTKIPKPKIISLLGCSSLSL